MMGYGATVEKQIDPAPGNRLSSLGQGGET